MSQETCTKSLFKCQKAHISFGKIAVDPSSSVPCTCGCGIFFKDKEGRDAHLAAE